MRKGAVHAAGFDFGQSEESNYFCTGEKGYHRQWDSRLFNYRNWEVLRYLLSNLSWWINEYRRGRRRQPPMPAARMLLCALRCCVTQRWALLCSHCAAARRTAMTAGDVPWHLPGSAGGSPHQHCGGQLN